MPSSRLACNYGDLDNFSRKGDLAQAHGMWQKRCMKNTLKQLLRPTAVFFSLLLRTAIAHSLTLLETSKATETLCADGKAEGGYKVTSQQSSYMIYLVCQGTSGIDATVVSETGGRDVVSMIYTSLDDDTFSFVSFHIGIEDAKTSTGMNVADGRLKLNYDLLKKGILSGTFKTLRMAEPISFRVNRSKEFPQIYSQANHANNFNKQALGRYKMVAPIGPMAPGTTIYLDEVGGIQRVNFQSSNDSVALYDGQTMEGADQTFVATSGMDDGIGGHGPLFHIRGKINGPNEIQFYYFSTSGGMSGPFLARK